MIELAVILVGAHVAAQSPIDPRCNGPSRYDAMRDADHSGWGTGNACAPALQPSKVKRK
jgi:hypothetical protein